MRITRVQSKQGRHTCNECRKEDAKYKMEIGPTGPVSIDVYLCSACMGKLKLATNILGRQVA